jgi:hypothetical protein
LTYKQAFYPSKPFVITAVIMLIIGSALGSIWMMIVYGLILPAELMSRVNLHVLVQFDGFLTLMIMGMGYLIVPRFRNISIPSIKIAYLSYVLVLLSIICSISVSWSGIPQIIHDFGSFLADAFRLIAVGIFCFTLILILRVRPKLLRMADYFILISVMLFGTLTVLHSFNISAVTNNILLWLMFPILMIFGVEYKTLPSFIGFIWPRKLPSLISATLLTLSLCFGIASIFHNSIIFSTIFQFSFLFGAIFFALAQNIFVGFDTSKIMQLSKGEKKARYKYTLFIAKLSFAILFVGIGLSITSIYLPDIFVIYDMWIHVIAIGFIGLTVALYLPILLSPILGRTIRFTHFSKLPIWLVAISLGIRVVGDIFIQSIPYYGEVSHQYLSIALSLSGWLTLAAILYFMFMVHRSMNVASQVFTEDGTTAL